MPEFLVMRNYVVKVGYSFEKTGISESSQYL